MARCKADTRAHPVRGTPTGSRAPSRPRRSSRSAVIRRRTDRAEGRNLASGEERSQFVPLVLSDLLREERSAASQDSVHLVRVKFFVPIEDEVERSAVEWETQAVGAKNLTDRKSTRLNSSHGYISYAVFCLKKKKIPTKFCFFG